MTKQDGIGVISLSKTFLRELAFYFKSNQAVTIAIVVQITALFVILGSCIAFTREIHYGRDDMEQIYEDKAIYHLIDGYYDPDDFSAFRDQPDSLKMIKNFYSSLDSADSFQYLAMFNQPILINTDIDSLSEKVVLDSNSLEKVNSFQINLQTQDYFNLYAEQGRCFTSSDFIDTKNNIIPVLIGNKYKKNISVGDKFKAIYYQQNVILRVIGILPQNTCVYYNGDIEFSLDDHIIIPYINYDDPLTELDDWFQKIVYFAMINGFISIESDDGSANAMKIELESIANETGFYNYGFIGSNPNIQQYRGLINIININYDLIRLLFLSLTILASIVVALQFYLSHQQNIFALSIHYLNGATMQYAIIEIISEVTMTVFAGLLISNVILGKIFHILDLYIMLLLASVSLLLSLSALAAPVIVIYRAEPILILNKNNDGLNY